MQAPRLRPFQVKLLDDIYNCWEAGAQNVMPVAATGSGKTVVLSHAMTDEPGPSLAIAHRQELVCQISMALARNGVPHQLITSGRNVSPLNGILSALHTAEGFGRMLTNRAKTGVVGVDTMIRCNDPWFDRVRLMVQDECFPAGTLVDGRPIESIRIGDYVTAYDEQARKFCRREVLRLFKNPAPEYMVRIKSGHHVLDCTLSHPILTQRGWIEACCLTTEDEIYADELHSLRSGSNSAEVGSTVPAKEKRSDLLCAGLRLGVSLAPFSTQDRSEEDCRAESLRAAAGSCMHGLRSTRRSVETPAPALQEDGSRLLQRDVQQGVPRQDQLGDGCKNKPQICQRQDEGEQPDGEARNPGAGVGYVAGNRPSACSKGRQRNAADCCRNDAVVTAHAVRLCDAAPDQDWSQVRQCARIPAVLQARCGASGIQDCGGSRRELASGACSKGAGCQEGCIFSWRRLDSVEVYKPADSDRPGDGFVYNIEVDELHTYTANGIVVHNCHHVVRGNKWGKAAEMLPNARGLLPTATPLRADGKGLGRHAHGIVDAMVLAPSMRQIIQMGYLTDYKIYCPTSSRLHRADMHVSQSTGEFVQAEMVREVKKAQIVGDVVGAYIKYAKDKRGVTFCVDVEAAEEQAAAFRAAGIPAAALSAKSSDQERAATLRKLKTGELLQVTNVDLFGEGFDLPAIEVVQFARPTQSFGLYVQQFGRVLRLMLTPDELRGYNDLTDEGRRAVIAASGKPYGIIIDHVGNVEAHGLPDKQMQWSLDARESRGSSTPGEIPLRVCTGCMQPYERIYKVCPYCGEPIPEPVSRSSIEHVDGDLIELSPEVLAALRGEIARIDGPPVMPWGAPAAVQGNVRKMHAARQEAQRDLRSAIAWWAGYHAVQGDTESASYRRFYLRYGVDVAGAQSLGRPEAEELAQRIHADMQRVGVDSTQCAITWAQREADR